MSTDRLWTWQRATALVPLALLSGAWTASLATGTATAAGEGGEPLPDGTLVPAEAIKAPASVSVPGEIAPGVPAGAADSIVSDSSTEGIPAAALAAYQRAAEVLGSADPSCNISWPLIAAIGRVESNHGRYGGNTLTDEGLSRPGIYGIPLDGSHGTARIDDTDAGELDDDPVFDRAVGPMQFIPSTWAVVGVDGDGDGVRNPQDIDDAALAAAVYLCSGEEDLSTTQGLRSAVYRYNHSEEYVDLVLAIMAAYARGDFSSIPNGSFAPTTFAPSFGAGPGADGSGSDRTDGRGDGGKAGDATSGGTGSGSTADEGGGAAGGGDDLGGADTGGLPSLPGTDGGDGGSGGSDGDSSGPLDDATDPLPDDVESPVDDVLSPVEEATSYCQDNAGPLGLQQCIDAYLDGGASAVQDLIDSLSGGLLGGGGDEGGDSGGGDGGGLLGGGDGGLLGGGLL